MDSLAVEHNVANDGNQGSPSHFYLREKKAKTLGSGSDSRSAHKTILVQLSDEDFLGYFYRRNNAEVI